MGYGVDDMWRIWNDLRRAEERLKWNGHPAGFGPKFNSMGRAASSHFNHGWLNEQMGRVGRVRQALDDSGPMAQRMIVQTLSGINLSTIWHILVSACQDIALYYGGAVAAGGFIGGVGGAFAGGVGALPGAAAGAAAGGYVGGWVMAMLGLKSLVEGVTQAVPEALRYYEKGFLEAWGPTRRDYQGFGTSTRGNPFFAAGDLANGHVIMISAILAVLAAYLTKGRGDKATLLKEIRQSPRLGPRVAQWVEQNEDKLRRMPLQSRGNGALSREEPPPPKRPREPAEEREPYQPKGMPKKKVPCFTTKDLPQGSVPEFDRQLKGQESGINDMTVDEYLNGREAFESGSSVRDPNVARQARAGFQNSLQRELESDLIKQGVSPSQAKTEAAGQAADKMKTLAALHNPDRVAAGKDVISDFGDRGINSRIGAQWKKGGRLTELDKAANNVPESMRGGMKMNAQLERCK